MIKVTIYQNKHHEPGGFDVKGHAEFAEPGADIVCAAASMLIINTINAVEKFTDTETSVFTDESDEQGSGISFRFKGRSCHDAVLLLKAMILGLQAMEDNKEYEPYIDIIFEEV